MLTSEFTPLPPSAGALIYFRQISMFYETLSNTLVSYGVAALLFILFERPVANLVRTLVLDKLKVSLQENVHKLSSRQRLVSHA